MSEMVKLVQEREVAVITIDNPPVNALSPGVPEGIVEKLEAIESDDSVKGAVLIGSGRTFVAGADIREFVKITSGKKDRGEGFVPLMRRVEDCSKLVVCAIHGTALGGGLELAMACHYRVAVRTAKMGQPEVHLGIIPGAAGTQRLPRLVGIVKAAELCAWGRPIFADEAQRIGLVDRVFEEDLKQGAVAMVRELIQLEAPIRRTRDLNKRLLEGGDPTEALANLRQEVRNRSRGAQAPLRAIESVEAAQSLSFDDGVRNEAQISRECIFSDESKALIHVFFAQRAAGKIPDVPQSTPQLKVRKAAVVGGGTMGVGITMTYVNSGIPVILKELDKAGLEQSIELIRKNYEVSLKKGKLTEEEVNLRIKLIQPTLDYDNFKDADIVVEAVFEDLSIKKGVFSELSDVCREDTILASNTSTLDIDALASQVKNPERVVGHHFFSPANIMRLLEIIRGSQSSKAVLATSLSLAKSLGKVGVMVGNCPGFVGNRMYGPYQREAQFLTEEGARVEDVDEALEDFGMAMGPLAVEDLAGLDVSWSIRKAHAHLVPPGMRPHVVADRLCEMGRLGQKTSKGWYRYEEGSRQRISDPEVDELIQQCATASGIKRRTVSPEEIVERTLYALINEGALILQEGFALRAADIDTIYVNGYGFPAHRGGPLWYADTLGLKKIHTRLCEFHQKNGFWWEPAPLLQELAEQGLTFAEYDQQRKG